MDYNIEKIFCQSNFTKGGIGMDDKEIKVERYKLENKSALKGQIVFTGSSLMEMFPINKLLAEHGDDTAASEAVSPTSF